MSSERKKATIQITQEDIERARHQDELLRKYGRAAQAEQDARAVAMPYEVEGAMRSVTDAWERDEIAAEARREEHRRQAELDQDK